MRLPRKIVVSLCSTALALLLVEVAIRCLLPPANRYFRRSTDSSLLYDLAPGTYEGQSYPFRWMLAPTRVTVDDNGCRRVPQSAKAGPSVLFLGDSMVFGFGVNDEEAVPAQFASLLPSHVSNCGVPGYGLDQYARMAELRVTELKPDLIVLGLHPQDLTVSYDLTLLASASTGLGRLTSLLRYELRSGPDEWLRPDTIKRDIERLHGAAGGRPLVLLETGNGLIHPTFSFDQAATVAGLPILKVGPHVQQDWLLKDNTHWTAKGCREVARLLRDYVAERPEMLATPGASTEISNRGRKSAAAAPSRPSPSLLSEPSHRGHRRRPGIA